MCRGLYFLQLTIVLGVLYGIIHAKDICEQGNSAKPILCIGKMRSHLLLVTTPEGQSKDMLVYELPLNSLNSSIDQLYISAPPKSLKEKWPKLYNNPYYGNATFADRIYNSFTAIDSEAEYLLLTTKKGNSPYAGVAYDITHDEAFKGIVYKGEHTQVLISANQLNNFFAIQTGGSGNENGLSIMRYRFVKNTVKESMTLQESIVPEHADFYRLCKVDQDSIKMVNSNKTCTPLNWPLTKGFLSDDKFYLFGDSQIFIFPYSLYQEVDKPVKVNTINYADFIRCSADVAGRSGNGTKVGIIIGIVLLLLILLLCLILFCTREAMIRRKKRKKKGKHGSKKSEKPGVFSFLAPSVRSSKNMEGPGKLSKAFSGRSVRSSGSLAKGGKLSARGPSYGGTTKRSALSSQHSNRSLRKSRSRRSGYAQRTARSSMGRIKHSKTK